MGESVVFDKVWYFTCKLFLCLIPFIINIVAVTLIFLISLSFPVNCSYLTCNLCRLSPTGWEGAEEHHLAWETLSGERGH